LNRSDARLAEPMESIRKATAERGEVAPAAELVIQGGGRN
jgi:hypothetical protein